MASTISQVHSSRGSKPQVPGRHVIAHRVLSVLCHVTVSKAPHHSSFLRVQACCATSQCPGHLPQTAAPAHPSTHQNLVECHFLPTRPSQSCEARPHSFAVHAWRGRPPRSWLASPPGQRQRTSASGQHRPCITHSVGAQAQATAAAAIKELWCLAFWCRQIC